MSGAVVKGFILGFGVVFSLTFSKTHAQWPQGKFWMASPFEWSFPDAEKSGKGMSWWSLDPMTHQLQGFFDLSFPGTFSLHGPDQARRIEVPSPKSSCQWQGFSMTTPGTFQPDQHPMINVPFTLPFLLQTANGDVSVLLEARYQNSTNFMDAAPFVLSFTFDWEVMPPGFSDCVMMSADTQKMEVRLPAVFLNQP